MIIAFYECVYLEVENLWYNAGGLPGYHTYFHKGVCSSSSVLWLNTEFHLSWWDLIQKLVVWLADWARIEAGVTPPQQTRSGLPDSPRALSFRIYLRLMLSVMVQLSQPKLFVRAGMLCECLPDQICARVFMGLSKQKDFELTKAPLMHHSLKWP